MQGKRLSEHIVSFLPDGYDPFADEEVIVGNTLQTYINEEDLSVYSTKLPLDAIVAALPRGGERIRILEIGCSNARNIKLLRVFHKSSDCPNEL